MTDLTLDTFVFSDDRTRDLLKRTIKSCKMQGIALPNMIFTGNSGCGKTTLARIVAREVGSHLTELVGPSITDPNVLIDAFIGYRGAGKSFTLLKDGDIVVIDEIQSVKKRDLEMIYGAMAEKIVPKKIGRGESFNYEIKNIPVFAMTNEPQKLSEAFKSRCDVHINLNNYTDDKIARIIKLDAESRKVKISDETALIFAKVSRSIPRVALSTMKTVYNYMVSEGLTDLNSEVLASVLDMLGIDENGLTEEERVILRTLFLYNKIGLSQLSAITKYPVSMIETELEPYLLIRGLIIRESGGRQLSKEGYNLVINKLREEQS